MKKSYRLSIVVPMFNEAAVLESFFSRVCEIVSDLTSDYEVICINDGSADDSLAKLKEFNRVNPKIKIVSFSRNFGKEAALMAGLEHASGDAVIPIDADLQDPPELIPKLVSKWEEGFDMVLAVRAQRDSDTLLKRTTANMFYRIAKHLSDTPIPANAGDFRLLDRRVVDALKDLPERNRFTKGIFGWLGFKQAEITYVRPDRVAGSSKWRYWRLWNYALDGIFSFSTLPLRIWAYIGGIISAVALLYMMYIILRTLVLGVDVPGYASLLVVMLFFSGLNMIGLGIMGEYLGRVFIEVKQRPLYLVDESIGLHDDK
ncbi:MAG: glycosyltransferase family 2 protein [Pseudomonadota bacterium]